MNFSHSGADTVVPMDNFFRGRCRKDVLKNPIRYVKNLGYWSATLYKVSSTAELLVPLPSSRDGTRPVL